MDNIQLEVKKVNLTPEIFKSKIAIELAKNELAVQKLHDIESVLVYNEDNLQSIADFISKIGKAEKVVEEVRTKEKAPILKDGKAVDDGAKILSTELCSLKKIAQGKYEKMCRDIEERRKKALEAQQKLEEQKKAVDNTIMTFSEKIANASTNEDLIAVERLLNLETANTSKYGEQLPSLKERCGAIRGLLQAQKLNLKNIAESNRKEFLATENGNDEDLEQITKERDEFEAKLSENTIKILETASQQAQSSGAEIAREIFPEVKPRRTTWEYEITDIKLLQKSYPSFVKLVPDEKAIIEWLRLSKEKGTIKEFSMCGIKVYQKKTY